MQGPQPERAIRTTTAAATAFSASRSTEDGQQIGQQSVAQLLGKSAAWTAVTMSTRSASGRPRTRGFSAVATSAAGNLPNRRLQAAGGGPLNGSIDRFGRVTPAKSSGRTVVATASVVVTAAGRSRSRARCRASGRTPVAVSGSTGSLSVIGQLAIVQAFERVRQKRQQSLVD